MMKIWQQLFLFFCLNCCAVSSNRYTTNGSDSSSNDEDQRTQQFDDSFNEILWKNRSLLTLGTVSAKQAQGRARAQAITARTVARNEAAARAAAEKAKLKAALEAQEIAKRKAEIATRRVNESLHLNPVVIILSRGRSGSDFLCLLIENIVGTSPHSLTKELFGVRQDHMNALPDPRQHMIDYLYHRRGSLPDGEFIGFKWKPYVDNSKYDAVWRYVSKLNISVIFNIRNPLDEFINRQRLGNVGNMKHKLHCDATDAACIADSEENRPHINVNEAVKVVKGLESFANSMIMKLQHMKIRYLQVQYEDYAFGNDTYRLQIMQQVADFLLLKEDGATRWQHCYTQKKSPDIEIEDGSNKEELKSLDMVNNASTSANRTGIDYTFTMNGSIDTVDENLRNNHTVTRNRLLFVGSSTIDETDTEDVDENVKSVTTATTSTSSSSSTAQGTKNCVMIGGQRVVTLDDFDTGIVATSPPQQRKKVSNYNELKNAFLEAGLEKYLHGRDEGISISDES